jgi:hypothetical protein
VTSDAEAKLERLRAQLLHHRESAREFASAGHAAMTERHERLVKLVCAEIRRHCLTSGLEIPDDVPPGPLD